MRTSLLLDDLVSLDPVEPGLAIPAPLLHELNRLMGDDFSDVRLHPGSAAAAALGALALASGDDIHFAPGAGDLGSIAGLRLLAHELTHVVQQRQGRVKRRGRGTELVFDATLEAEADEVAERAARLLTPIALAGQPRRAAVSQPRARRRRRAGAIVQPYVILGREDSGWFGTFGLSGETMRRELTLDDVAEVMEKIKDYFFDVLPNELESIGTSALTPEYVAHMKELASHVWDHEDVIEAKLREWIGARREATASLIGDDAEAAWRVYDTVRELGIALAHETHPHTLQNLKIETQVAQAVNQSAWIRDQLESVVRRVNQYHWTKTSWARFFIDYPEYYLSGSYNLGTSLKGKLWNAVTTVKGKSVTESITASIVTLHDTMERWSSSNAGSIAVKIHEKLIEKILPEPRDDAFNSTVLDVASSNLKPGKDGRITVTLKRQTRKVTEERREEELFRISQRRALRKGMKNRDDMVELAKLEQSGASQEEIERARARIARKREKRTLALERDGYSVELHRDDDHGSRERSVSPQKQSVFESREGESTLRRRRRGSEPPPKLLSKPTPEPEYPERGMLGEWAHGRRKEAEKERLAKVVPGKVDKSSQAKGRKNVGTRDEFDLDTLTARLFSAPVTAGRSMTTARMMQLVETVGGTVEEKIAVAYALFAYWRLTYNKGLTPIHTYVETMDVAYNYGVPYVPFHYPLPSSTGVIDYVNPKNNKLHFMGSEVVSTVLFFPMKRDDKPSSDKPSSDKPSSDKPSSDKPSSDKLSPKKVLGQDNPILRGRLTEDGPELVFREHRINNPDGRDCGFIALGVDRDRAVQQLLAASGSRAIRRMVAPEIRAAFLEGTLPRQIREDMGLINRFEQRYHRFVQENDARVRQANNTLGLQGGHRRNLDGLIQLLQGRNDLTEDLVQLRTQLLDAQSELGRINAKLEEYCETHTLFEAFVTYYVGAGGWLSYNRTLDERVTSSIDAIAQINNIQFYIWQRAGDGQLRLVHANNRPLAPNVVHMLHTDGLTHYNFLEQIR